MDFGMLIWVALILAVVMALVSLNGAIKIWKSGNKFMGAIFFAVTVAIGLFIYAMFGQRIAALFH